MVLSGRIQIKFIFSGKDSTAIFNVKPSRFDEFYLVFLQLLFSNTGIASSNSWELLEPEARLFFRQFVIIDGDESLLICHGLKRVDRCSFDHEGRPA